MEVSLLLISTRGSRPENKLMNGGSFLLLVDFGANFIIKTIGRV
jgi:hypothetical protein